MSVRAKHAPYLLHLRMRQVVVRLPARRDGVGRVAAEEGLQLQRRGLPDAPQRVLGGGAAEGLGGRRVAARPEFRGGGIRTKRSRSVRRIPARAAVTSGHRVWWAISGRSTPARLHGQPRIRRHDRRHRLRAALGHQGGGGQLPHFRAGIGQGADKHLDPHRTHLFEVGANTRLSRAPLRRLGPAPPHPAGLRAAPGQRPAKADQD